MFFQFVVRVYPSFDDQANTIVSDRHKGYILSVMLADFIALVIDARTSQSDTGDQLFRHSMNSSIPELDRVKETYINALPDAVMSYIISIPHQHQFPAARVAEQALMYGRSTNGISEATNSANMRARVRGMDMFNVLVALVSMERARSMENQSTARTLLHQFTDFARKKYAAQEALATKGTVRGRNTLSGSFVFNVNRKT